MKNLIALSVSLCMLFAITHSGFAQASSSVQKTPLTNLIPLLPAPDIKLALPNARNLAGYGAIEVGTNSDHYILFKAIRKSDGLILDVDLMSYPDVAEADRSFALFQETAPVKLLQTSWSGRKLAPKIYRSNYSNTGSSSDDLRPRQSFCLMLQDGRAVVRVRLTGPVLRDAKGEAVRDTNGDYIQYYFTDADLLFVENTAYQTLQRMTVLGFGSRPASEATAQAKQEILERKKQAAASMRPEHP